jgi:hypothetical protein
MSFDFTKTRTTTAAIAEMRGNFQPRNYLFFSLKNNLDTAVVRFIGAESAYCHKIEVPGSKYGEMIVSADQSGRYPDASSSCPLVQSGAKRSLRGWILVIWRNAPVYKKGPDGKFLKDQYNNLVAEGTRDQVALWKGGLPLLEELDGADAAFKGLSSRDFRVTRKGTGLDTSWQIFPADPDGGPQPMTEADKEIAASAPDLKEFTIPMPIEKLEAIARGDFSVLKGGDSAPGVTRTAEEAAKANPFARKA